MFLKLVFLFTFQFVFKVTDFFFFLLSGLICYLAYQGNFYHIYCIFFKYFPNLVKNKIPCSKKLNEFQSGKTQRKPHEGMLQSNCGKPKMNQKTLNIAGESCKPCGQDQTDGVAVAVISIVENSEWTEVSVFY